MAITFLLLLTSSWSKWNFVSDYIQNVDTNYESFSWNKKQ